MAQVEPGSALNSEHYGKRVRRRGVFLNPADEEKWDEKFPNHALSRVRIHLKRLTGTVKVTSIEGAAIRGFASQDAVGAFARISGHLKQMKDLVLPTRNQAASHDEEMIQPNSQAAIAHIENGNLLETGERHDEAIAQFNEAIRLNPKTAIAYFKRGTAYLAKSSYDPAIADFSEAIKLYPNFAPIYVFEHMHRDNIGQLFPEFAPKVHLLGSLVGTRDYEIPDPAGGPESGIARCYKVIEKACQELSQRLQVSGFDL